MKILIATTNKKKLREMKLMMNDIDFVTLDDLNISIESPEDHDTLQMNAIQKANFYYEMTKMPVIADDSGLEVFALDGFPGVKSKRWMDGNYTDKTKRLMEMIGDKPTDSQYACAIAYVDGKDEVVFTGTWKGKLVEPIYVEDVFGYDGGFFSPEFNKRASELTTDEKNALSHRGKAIEKFKKWFANKK